MSGRYLADRLRRNTPGLAGLLLAILLAGCRQPTALPAAPGPASPVAYQPGQFSFVVTADMRDLVNSKKPGQWYFEGVCAALQRTDPGSFMICPGDVDPPGPVRAALDRYLGTNYPWYPVVGNHDLEKSTNILWIRDFVKTGIVNLVRRGPPGAEHTMYSFDWEDSHFVILDNYYKGAPGDKKEDLPGRMLTWLDQDLAATRKPLIWVVGHRPIQVLPDMDNHKVRHAGELLSKDLKRVAQFTRILRKRNVRAYLCGHTHCTSVAEVEGVWQIDAGHARGAGDTSTASTYVRIRTAGSRAWADFYRSDPTGRNYTLRRSLELE